MLQRCTSKKVVVFKNQDPGGEDDVIVAQCNNWAYFSDIKDKYDPLRCFDCKTKEDIPTRMPCEKCSKNVILMHLKKHKC
jgi:hypothetical protein